MSLKTIAEMTGVSISTVSRVLNGNMPTCASAEVKERIWAAANAINYRPNVSAKNLRCGTDDQTAYKVAVVHSRIHNLDDDPFFAELFQCIRRELLSRGMILSAVSGAENRSIEDIESSDGIIILGRCSERLICSLRESTPNLVGIWRNIQNFNIDEIVCDGKKAAAAAMEHLMGLGHKKIAYIGDCSYESRYVGYCESIINHSLPLDYSLIVQTDQSENAGCEAMKQIAESGKATAVLCANDITALGALRALRALHIKNISVIAIDNTEKACSSNPMLTTVNIPRDDMAHMAVRVLEDRIEGGHREYMRIEFPCRIVNRDSCFYV